MLPRSIVTSSLRPSLSPTIATRGVGSSCSRKFLIDTGSPILSDTSRVTSGT